MRKCDQELCAYWTGHGCACGLFDTMPQTRLERIGTALVDGFNIIINQLLATPPISWFTKPVGPQR